MNVVHNHKNVLPVTVNHKYGATIRTLYTIRHVIWADNYTRTRNANIADIIDFDTNCAAFESSLLSFIMRDTILPYKLCDC